MKNPCGKIRPIENPYEIWEGNGFEHRVLKKYQSPDREVKNIYARWFVAVKSPFTKGRYDFQDGYVSDIQATAVLTHTSY